MTAHALTVIARWICVLWILAVAVFLIVVSVRG